MNGSKLEQYEHGMTPLHRAAREGDIERVKQLIHANPTLVLELNGNREYPLFSALFLPVLHDADMIKRKEEIFRLLLDHAPQIVMHVNNDNETVLHKIAANGFAGLLTEVFEHADPLITTIRNNDGQCPIHVAILNGQIAVVRELLTTCKCSKGLFNVEGNLPLHLAAANGTMEMVTLCLEADPTVINVTNESGATPLSLSKQYNSEDVQTYLIQKGADESLASDLFSTICETPFRP